MFDLLSGALSPCTSAANLSLPTKWMNLNTGMEKQDARLHVILRI